MDFLYSSVKSIETEKILLSKYFHEFRLSLETVPDTIKIGKKRKMKKSNEVFLLGKKITKGEYKEIASICSVSKLKVPGEPEQIPDVYLDGMWYVNETCTLPNDCSLQTVKYLSERKQSPSRLHSNRIIRNRPKADADLRLYEHVVVVVNVYEPFVCNATRDAGKPFAEIQILGEQTLADLRDRIICPKDLECLGEVSDSPVAAMGMKGKEMFPSSMFFIEDIFYNDTRTPGHVDYSEVIKDWAKLQGVTSLETDSMENTKIGHLAIRFGRPYMFVHVADCEHLIVFRSARLLHPTDCVQFGKYPLYTSLYRKQSKMCMMCQKIAAKWLVRDCDRLIYDTAYLCVNCFESFLYVKGKKVGNFKAFVYLDRASILV